MPARPRIAALIAGLALAAPPALAESGREQTLPRTGFDVLPVAAIGLALLLGGLALRRRPHAGP
jgi:LPXTG-motif cell wall-anchored protein